MAGCPQSSAAIIRSHTSSDRARMLTVFAPLPRRIWVPTSAATAWRGRARSACSGVGLFRMHLVDCAASQSRSHTPDGCSQPGYLVHRDGVCLHGDGQRGAGRPFLHLVRPLQTLAKNGQHHLCKRWAGAWLTGKWENHHGSGARGGTRSPTLALSERHDQAPTLLSLGIQLPAQGMGGRVSETNQVEERLRLQGPRPQLSRASSSSKPPRAQRTVRGCCRSHWGRQTPL